MLSIKREMEWKLSQDEVENSAELVRVHLLSIELLANELSDYFKMLANERNQAKSELGAALKNFPPQNQKNL